MKLRTVNSHFATLPVRHRASGMYLRGIYRGSTGLSGRSAKLIHVLMTMPAPKPPRNVNAIQFAPVSWNVPRIGRGRARRHCLRNLRRSILVQWCGRTIGWSSSTNHKPRRKSKAYASACGGADRSARITGWKRRHDGLGLEASMRPRGRPRKNPVEPVAKGVLG